MLNKHCISKYKILNLLILTLFVVVLLCISSIEYRQSNIKNVYITKDITNKQLKQFLIAYHKIPLYIRKKLDKDDIKFYLGGNNIVSNKSGKVIGGRYSIYKTISPTIELNMITSSDQTVIDQRLLHEVGHLISDLGSRNSMISNSLKWTYLSNRCYKDTKDIDEFSNVVITNKEEMFAECYRIIIMYPEYKFKYPEIYNFIHHREKVYGQSEDFEY